MTKPEEATVVLTTCPDLETAESIAKLLVIERSAACVNIVEKIHSTYRWEDGIESAQETLLIIKTTKQRYGEVETTIQREHPYEVPEIIAIDIKQGAPSYLDWINHSTIKE